jgi:hypothetical protein
MRQRYFLFFALLFAGLKIFSQDLGHETDDSTCPQKDLPDILREWMGKPPIIKPIKLGTLILVPTIGSNPAVGFSVGAGGQYAFRRREPNSLYSLMSASLSVTTKKQMILQIRNNIYTKNNKFFLSGDWRFLVYSQSTYGLSTKAPDGSVIGYENGGVPIADDSLAQPMKFNWVRFYQTVSIRLRKSIYVGIGYHLDYHFNIIDEDLDTASQSFTSHYLYSQKHGFNPQEYLLSGVSINFVVDTRDNMINSYKGYFANINYRFFPAFLGNKKTGNYLLTEWRSFHSLSAGSPRHLLAFWLLGAFSPNGQLPYLDLPALGYDQRGRSGRGYTQGRYRGPDLVYGETEYRFPISQCGGILRGVLFLNAITADAPDKKVGLFDYIAPGYGAGLRIMVDKHSRTNLQVDFGFGKHSHGFYLNATEVF